MNLSKSKSQKKREAKTVEDLAKELVDLPASVLRRFPCEEEIRIEIQAVKKMDQFGARRRQIKYLAKLLRDTELSPFFTFLEESQKSHLRENITIRRLEQLRDRIIHEDDEEQALQEVKEELPDINLEMLQELAGKYRWTRNQRFSREIFRQLKIAQGHAKHDEETEETKEKALSQESLGEGI